MPNTDLIVHGTQDNFEDEVTNASELVLVDFGAPWCGPCRMLEPQLQRLASAYGGRVKVVKIDVDEEKALSEQFQIRSIPTLHMYVGGVFIEAKSGAMSYLDLEEWILERSR